MKLRVLAVIILFLIIVLSMTPSSNSTPPGPSALTTNLEVAGRGNLRYNCSEVYVLDVRGWSLEDLVTAVSLQGLVNRDAPRLYLVYSDGDAKLARYAVEELLGCQMQETRSLRWLIEKYRSHVKGIVIYDPNLLDTLNLAITLAGLNDALILHPASIKLVGGLDLPVVADLRGRYVDKIQVYEDVYKLLPMTNKSSIAVIYTGVVNMADYAIKHRMAVVGLSPLPEDKDERSLLEKILEAHPGRLAFGFFPKGGTGEYYGVNLLSRYGKTLIVTIHASSLSFTEHLYPLLEVPQQGDPEPFIPDSNGVYAAIFISDGDNIAFLQHLLLTDSWWYHPLRGSIPIGWTVNPWIARLAPNLLVLLREEATANDEIVAGVAVAGHMNPTLMPEEALENLSKAVKPVVEKAGLDTLLSWDPLGYRGFFYFKSVYHYFYPALFPGEHGFPGLSLWEGIPVIYTVNLYNYENYREVVDNILSHVSERPLFLAFLVNVWSFKNLARVAELADYLKSKGVILVGPREMAATIKRYYILIAKPWFTAQRSEGTLLALEVMGCKYIKLYSSVSGDLLAMIKVDPLLKTPQGWMWASQMECSLFNESSSTFAFVFRGEGIEVTKTYSIEEWIVNVSVSIRGDVEEIVDVALDQLDTIVWPPRGLIVSKDILGPRYAYVPDSGVIERSLGPDPFTICRGCSEVVIYDSAYPYPRALGIAINSSTTIEVLDAFNVNKESFGGDADGDGHGEFHAIALKIGVDRGELVYNYIIAPLSHGWTLRLPEVDPHRLVALLHPIFQDILYGTGFNEALSTVYPKPATITITTTQPVTTMETTKITITFTKTVTTTHWKTYTTTFTRELIKTKTETYTMRETLTETKTKTVTITPNPLRTPVFLVSATASSVLLIILIILAGSRK